MKSKGITYLLCSLGFLGIGGIHRFYLGKYGTGILYLLTGGFFYIGTVIDLFRIPEMVENINLKWQLQHGASVNINIHGQTDQQISIGRGVQSQPYHPAQKQTSRQKFQPPEDPTKTLETTILKLARKFQGKLTPVELAANSSLSLEEADKALEDIVRKGYADMKVTDEGNILYEFPGFLHFDSSNSQGLKGRNDVVDEDDF